MDANLPARPFDELAADLDQAVVRAAASNADAATAAGFDTMSGILEDKIPVITATTAMLDDAQYLQLEPVERDDVRARRDDVARRLGAVREQLARDPTAIRSGSAWRDAKAAIEALQNSLTASRDAAYRRLLRGFEHEDRQQLATLPPDTPGAAEYSAAIERFMQLRETPPRSAADVAQAVTVGERMRNLRAETEESAVPSEHRVAWRLLLSSGLPLGDLTDSFTAWLTSRGLEDQVVMRLDIS